MDKYTLYLDESETSNAGRKPTFVIAGIIIKDDYHDTTFTEKMNTLKKIIWSDMSNASDIILHEKEVKDATQHRVDKEQIKPEYKRFYNNKENSTKLYTEYSRF